MTLLVKNVLPRRSLFGCLSILFYCFLFLGCLNAEEKDAPDVLVLSNGDTLHGKLVNAISGKVTFHTDPLGDVTVDWSKIRELHAPGRFAVLAKGTKVNRKATIPTGSIEVANKSVSVQPERTATPQTIPVAQTEYVVDYPTLDKEMNHRPSFLAAWNGAATAGATLVQATQNQHTFSGAIDMVRIVPAATWLSPRNRTSVDFSGAYGKITESGTPSTKTAIYHAGAERDQYITARVFVLGQVAFDHNFSQDLDLQQIYGGGLGWTAFNTPVHQLDLKGTVQYERQQFISGGPSSHHDLVGSTFSADYIHHMELFTFAQSLAYIPSYNEPHAYSLLETNSFAFHAYKNLSFSMGTTDSYLNNPPPTSTPPQTKRNSFQFTMGLSYAVKSKY